MSILHIDGAMLKEMFVSGATLLEKNRQNVDALNVFPVPDGDTGTNMTQTIMSAVKAINGRSFPSVSDVAGAAAKGALMGARGNSGVILSQIFRGFAKALEGAEELDAELFIKALSFGAETAYKAILKPKEGTILTVQRVIAEETELELQKTNDLLEIMRRIVLIGDAILKKTPEMLPVLKQAGVVDSGGKGLMIVYTGFLAALSGEPIGEMTEETADSLRLPGEYIDDHEALSEITFTYCTEFIVSHPKPEVKDADVARLRRRLEKIGDCVLVIGDLEVVKVHVHTNDPGKAIQMAIELGELDAIKIDNMLEEFRARQEKNAPVEEELKQFGIVSVALGAGFVEIFNDLSVDLVVDGGQTMNPSIEDISKAIDSVPAREVFVLPNNTNIIMAAQQAAELSDKRVYVLSTKSVPMGIAAAIAFVPDESGEENERNMMEAAQRVHTASVTYAVRDTVFDNRDIREGDIMGLIDNKLSLVGSDKADVARELLSTMVTDETELITIYYGEDVSEESAQALNAEIANKYELCDVSVYSGAQPLYYYLIAVE